MSKELAISLLLRFARGGLATATGVMVTIVPMTGGWDNLSTWLSSLALAGIVGFISGVLLAADKWFRSVE